MIGGRKKGDATSDCPKCGGPRAWFLRPARQDWSRRCLPCTNEATRKAPSKTQEALRLAYAKRYAKDPQLYIDKTVAWQKANPAKCRAKGARRRAVKKALWCGETCCKHEDITPFYDVSKAECVIKGCTSSDIHVDHIIPLNSGGPHCRHNLQHLCQHHNSSKGPKNMQVWLDEQGLTTRKKRVN